MECGVFGEHYEARTFIPDIGIHPPGMALTVWVRLNRLRSGVRSFPLLFTQMGYDPFCGL